MDTNALQNRDGIVKTIAEWQEEPLEEIIEEEILSEEEEIPTPKPRKKRK